MTKGILRHIVHLFQSEFDRLKIEKGEPVGDVILLARGFASM